MKKTDKVLLLAELLNVDTSSFIKEKRIDFNNSSLMEEINAILKENKKNHSPKFIALRKDYQKIKSADFKTIQEYIAYLTKAEHILYNLKNKSYINPLMCSYKEGETKLANLIINFDGKDTSLGDLIMLEIYSDKYKIDTIKYLIIAWRKELDDNFIRPLQLLLTYPKNLPIKRIIPINKIFISLLLIAFNILLLYSFFLKDDYIYPVVHFDYSKLYISVPYFILCFLIFIYDVAFLILLLLRRNEHKMYFYAQKHLIFSSLKVMKRIDKNTSKLYRKIIKCIVSKEEIKERVNSYSIKEEYLIALDYLKEENERPSLEEDHISSYEIVLIELILIIIVYFVIFFSLKGAGIIR